MKENPLLALKSLGQSVWIDTISRRMITSGELERLVNEDGVCGVTSNPAIFEKAIVESDDYDDAIRTLALGGKSPEEIYRSLTVADIQNAADILRPSFEKMEGNDGFVSLEVNPHLAYDTMRTVREALQLWDAVNRPNVFIKVPATLEGIPAIRRLIGSGVNVNVTLLFGLDRYEMVADAFVAGLEDRAARGQSLENVSSVASFFLSRIDVLVDPALEHIVAAGGGRAQLAGALRGRVAIASAKAAHSIGRRIFSGERFEALTQKGARPQRLLWASTSAKNPAYSDVKYVEPLIGQGTINTMPLETLDAYRDHGNPALRLEDGLDEAENVLSGLKELEISLADVTKKLEDEGVDKFNKPYDKLISVIEKKRKAALEHPPDRGAVHFDG